MKRVMFLSGGVLCLSIAVILIAAGSACAILPPVGYIGIFKDDTHATEPAANTVCPSPFTEFECWIWCLPSERGLHAAAFDLSVPPAVGILSLLVNPIIPVIIGGITEGIYLEFAENACQMDWVWTHRLTCMSFGSLPTKITIVPHPYAQPPAYRFASCEPGYPSEPCINLTPLYICWTPDPGPLRAVELSWGAIKSLF